jgi:putative DNA primase/helicase
MNEDDPLARTSRRKRPQLPSDVDLAMDFTLRAAEQLRYCHERGCWFRWEGSRWKLDRLLEVRQLATDHCDKWAQTLEAKSLGSRKRIDAVIHIACALSPLATTIDQWDQNPDLLCTPTGIVELTTGRIRPATMADYVTRQTALAPRPGCRRWLAALDEIFIARAEVIAFLKRWAGYCLTGHVREHKFVFAHGWGRNGKDTVCGAIQAVVGDYARTVPIETLLASRWDRHPTEVALLRGVRLGVASETPKGRRWDEARLKLLTGGGQLSARFMGGNFFDFTPTAKLMVMGNEQPKLATIDEAWRQRMLFLPFEQRFTGEAEVKGLKDQLLAEEGPGILAWAIEGAAEWYRSGLQPPDSVLAATEAYITEQDAYGRWISDCLDTKDRAATAHLKDLFTSWRSWAESQEEYPDTRNALSTYLTKRRYRKEKDEKGVFFIGLAIRPPAQKQGDRPH